MYNAYHARGYEALAIDLGESNDKVRPIARNYSFAFLRDSSYTAWNLYKMANSLTPLNYIIDTAGLVVNSEEGLFDSLTIDGWIKPYLAGVEEASPVALLGFATAGANPAIGHSAVRFSLPRAADVTPRVYSTSGALVRTLADGRRSAGTHAVNWDLRDNAGRRVGTGLYFCELTSGMQVASTKISVLK